MFSTLVSIALLSTLAISSVVADLSVASPNFVQCGKVELTWQQGTGPYDVVIVPPTDPCGTVLADLGSNNAGTTLDWTVTLAAGTKAQISVLDADGVEGWSGNITVAASSDTSCLKTTAKPSSTTSSDPEAATTLVVPPSSETPSGSAASGGSDGGAAQPVGAANAGLNPTSGSSGALSSIQHSAPTIALGAIAAVVFAIAL